MASLILSIAALILAGLGLVLFGRWLGDAFSRWLDSRVRSDFWGGA